MRVVVLGCGGSSGVPMIGGEDGRGDWGLCDPLEPRNRRTRASIVLQTSGGATLVDTGPDMREQLLACGIPSIDSIIFTHAHADHVSGIDDVRGLNRVGGRPIASYGFPETVAELRQRFGFAFLPWSPPGFFRPVLDAHSVEPGTSIDLGGSRFALFEQTHGRTRTLGFRVGGFAYSTDVVALEPRARAILQGVDTWMVDAFQRDPHSSHAHLGQAIDWAKQFGVRRTVLTHMGIDLDWAWLKATLPEGVEPAFDGMEFQFPG